ncbi:MAG: polysaccharide deacetylase family protein [Rhodospirillales bacterium]|nr:polysaccharide deacetylase family protein [Rhodospirillales bacterium]
MKPVLCIAIHDVAPATWSACEALLKMLERLGSPAVTLLVVPDYHRSGRIDDAPGFVAAVNAWIAAGAEVALHGYYHLDEAPAPGNPHAWLQRRILTDGEGEFAALTQVQAADRITRGLAQLEDGCGWQVSGFVPPAWLASVGARAAIRRSSLLYTSTRSGLLRLTDAVRIGAPCLTASTRSPLRRCTSRLWLESLAAATAKTPLLRIALHPADAGHVEVTNFWARLIERLLEQRSTLTKRQAVERYPRAEQG